MGIYQDLLKKKILIENEDGSITANHEAINNNYKETYIPSKASDMSVIKGLNKMIDNIDTSNIQDTSPLGQLYKNSINNIKSFTPKQREIYAQQITRNNVMQDFNKEWNKSLWDKIQDIANPNNNNIMKLPEQHREQFQNTVNDAKKIISSISLKPTNNVNNRAMLEATKRDIDSINNRKSQNINTRGFFGQMNEIAKRNNNSQLGKLPISQMESEEVLSNNIEKNKNMFEDIGSLTKLTGLGISSGSKNTLNFVENANEQLYNDYKKNKEIQFLNSQKVNAEDKAQAKLNQNIETNLVKKSIRDSIAKDEQSIQEEQRKLSNPISQKLGEVMPSMGQMLPGTVLSAVNPVLGTGYFYTSSGGSYINDGLQRGMTEKQAWKYGNIMAALESASETVITGQQLNKVAKAFKGKGISKSILNSYGFNILENAVQEAVMEPAQELTAQLVAGNDKANWNGIWERMGSAGLNGGLMGVISNGATYGLERTGNAYNKIKNGESLTQNEINSIIQENVKTRGQEAVQNDFKQGANQVFQQVATIQNEQSNSNMQQITQPIQENTPNQNVVANNQQTLYNNSNERESGINEINTGNKQDDRRRVQELFELYKRGTGNENGNNAGIQENQRQQITQDTIKQELVNYADKNPKSNLTQEEQEIKKIFNDLGGDVVFYEFGGDNFFAGLSNTNKAYIDTASGENIKNIAYHELIHFLRQNKNEIFENEINPIINKIASDFDYQEAIFNYAKSSEGFEIGDLNFNKQHILAEEIIADTTASIYGDLEANYGLSQNDINSIKMSIDKILSNNYDNVPTNKSTKGEEKNPTRHEVIQNNRELARENIKNISTWKDKKRGLSYQLETMERNMYDIIPDKNEAQKMNDTYFEPIHKSEAEKQKFINKYNDKIKELKLNKYEAEAVQYLGEQKYNPDFKSGDEETIANIDKEGKRISENIKKGKINEQKVNKAIETFRSIYDELFELENKTLRENGYKEKPYRKGYFPHFVDYVPETRTEKVLNKLGFKIDKRPLPTDIAGITEQFVPGKTWNKSSLERKGNKTDYNALKGFDTYIAQASDNIFHTENIQKLRGLENEIRYQYSDKGIKERIDNILSDESLYEEEKQSLIDEIFKQTENPMPNLVTELRRYTNALANKKSEADRSIENMVGRSVYSTINAIENRFGANAVGLNIGSAVTNFIPITQAWSQIGTKNMGRAVIDTVKSYLNDDGFVDNSTFLTNRVNQADKLYKTSLEKISDKTSFLFDAIDEVTSNIVVRGKYLENIQNGMNEQEAIKNADRFASNVIADRSKGALPTKFEEKNPITKMFTQFQLEVNNQYRYMFKDLPRDLKEKGLASIALAFFKMFLGAWIYNEASEAVTGRKPAFSPIDIVKSSYDTISNDKLSTFEKISNIGKEMGEELPFVSGLVGGGRVPVNGAIPDIGNLTKAGIGLTTGEMDSNKATDTIGKELSKPLYYLLPPFGGGQLKKTIEGIQTVQNGGSYGIDSKGQETLQFPVENPNVGDYIKAGIFGKYALPEAKTYTDSGYKSLNAKQTKTYKESRVPYKEYLEYLDEKLTKDIDKINYIEKQKWGDNQKWGIYKNDILSDKERKDGTSQLSDALYMTSNGISKAQYMKLYNKAKRNNIELPTEEEFKELKNANVSLENNIDYKIGVKAETLKQKNEGKIKEDGQIKDKDKIGILLNSQYTDNEKQYMYENYIKQKNDDDKIDVYTALMKNGMNINQYLKYAQQEFESDKIDDGTINGKSVDTKDEGSKKNKMYSWVKENITDYNNAIIILGSQYSLNSNEKRKLVDTINNMNLSSKEKLELFSKMKGFTVYKNGDVKWK